MVKEQHWGEHVQYPDLGQDVQNRDAAEPATNVSPQMSPTSFIKKAAPHEKTLTWLTIAEHCDASSLWTVVHNEVYDLTDYLPEHPGGNLLLQIGGTDGTVQFETYHFSEHSRHVLRRYQIGSLAHGETPCILMGDFFCALKKKVSHASKHTAGFHSKAASTLEFLFVVAFYGAAVYALCVRGMMVAAPVIALLAVRMMTFSHMLGHASMLPSYSLNYAGFVLLMCLGEFSPQYFLPEMRAKCKDNRFVLKRLRGNPWDDKSLSAGQHNSTHHIATNDAAIDDDIMIFGEVLGVRPPQQPHLGNGKVPGLALLQGSPLVLEWTLTALNFLFGVYPLGTCGWSFFNELPCRLRYLAAKNTSAMAVACGMLLQSSIIGNCIAVHGLRFWLLCQLLVLAVFLLACHPTGTFAMHHIYEKDIRPLQDWRMDWGRSQVCATTNFVPGALSGFGNSPYSSVWHLEHHLFPRVNPRQLWRLAPIVKETCVEFGLQYREVNRSQLQSDLRKFVALELKDDWAKFVALTLKKAE